MSRFIDSPERLCVDAANEVAVFESPERLKAGDDDDDVGEEDEGVDEGDSDEDESEGGDAGDVSRFIDSPEPLCVDAPNDVVVLESPERLAAGADDDDVRVDDDGGAADDDDGASDDDDAEEWRPHSASATRAAATVLRRSARVGGSHASVDEGEDVLDGVQDEAAAAAAMRESVASAPGPRRSARLRAPRESRRDRTAVVCESGGTDGVQDGAGAMAATVRESVESAPEPRHSARLRELQERVVANDACVSAPFHGMS